MDHITILVAVVIVTALSTTQVASGSILGASLGRRPAEVRWGVAGHMVIAWLVTLPAAALVGGLAASAVTHGGNLGTTVVAPVGVAMSIDRTALGEVAAVSVGVTVAVVTVFARSCRSSTEIRHREQG